MKVTLTGGPAEGTHEVPDDLPVASPLLLEFAGAEDPNRVARYRPLRGKPGAYRFDGYDRVVARLPRPGAKP